MRATHLVEEERTMLDAKFEEMRASQLRGKAEEQVQRATASPSLVACSMKEQEGIGQT